MVMVTCPWLAGTAVAQEQTSAGGRMVGGFDVLFLRAYGNAYDQEAHEELSGDSVAPNNDFEISPRAWFGYVGPSGFGVRSRWFQYQHDLKAGTGVYGQREGRNYLDVYAVDLDFMQQLHFGNWDFNGGAGIRGGGVKRRTLLDDDLVYSRFEGVGPTIFAELKRPVADTGISLIAKARGALLFGDDRWIAEDENGGTGVAVGVGEVQLGAEYARQLGYGATAFVQCVWEGQLWSNVTPMLSHRDDLGLMGVGINFGIAR
ncbi:MAG: hypothetical protein JXB10_03975 [Pirellulales bacterium]|nr:hypothetical protein [Pirellulales bacterium]